MIPNPYAAPGSTGAAGGGGGIPGGHWAAAGLNGTSAYAQPGLNAALAAYAASGSHFAPPPPIPPSMPTMAPPPPPQPIIANPSSSSAAALHAMQQQQHHMNQTFLAASNGGGHSRRQQQQAPPNFAPSGGLGMMLPPSAGGRPLMDRATERRADALRRRQEQQERLQREQREQTVSLDLFAKPEKVTHAADAQQVSQVLGNFSNAQRIITGKTSCIGIDYQPQTPAPAQQHIIGDDDDDVVATPPPGPSLNSGLLDHKGGRRPPATIPRPPSHARLPGNLDLTHRPTAAAKNHQRGQPHFGQHQQHQLQQQQQLLQPERLLKQQRLSTQQPGKPIVGGRQSSPLPPPPSAATFSGGASASSRMRDASQRLPKLDVESSSTAADEDLAKIFREMRDPLAASGGEMQPPLSAIITPRVTNHEGNNAKLVPRYFTSLPPPVFAPAMIEATTTVPAVTAATTAAATASSPSSRFKPVGAARTVGSMAPTAPVAALVGGLRSPSLSEDSDESEDERAKSAITSIQPNLVPFVVDPPPAPQQPPQQQQKVQTPIPVKPNKKDSSSESSESDSSSEEEKSDGAGGESKESSSDDEEEENNSLNGDKDEVFSLASLMRGVNSTHSPGPNLHPSPKVTQPSSVKMLSDDDGDVSDHIADLLSQNRSTNQLTDLDLVSAAVPVSLSAARPHLDLAMERPLSPLELSPPRPATMETMLSPLVAVVLPSLEEESAGSGTSRASSSRRTTVRPQKRATARRQSTQNVQDTSDDEYAELMNSVSSKQPPRHRPKKSRAAARTPIILPPPPPARAAAATPSPSRSAHTMVTPSPSRATSSPSRSARATPSPSRSAAAKQLKPKVAAVPKSRKRSSQAAAVATIKPKPQPKETAAAKSRKKKSSAWSSLETVPTSSSSSSSSESDAEVPKLVKYKEPEPEDEGAEDEEDAVKSEAEDDEDWKSSSRSKQKRQQQQRRRRSNSSKASSRSSSSSKRSSTRNNKTPSSVAAAALSMVKPVLPSAAIVDSATGAKGANSNSSSPKEVPTAKKQAMNRIFGMPSSGGKGGKGGKGGIKVERKTTEQQAVKVEAVKNEAVEEAAPPLTPPPPPPTKVRNRHSSSKQQRQQKAEVVAAVAAAAMRRKRKNGRPMAVCRIPMQLISRAIANPAENRFSSSLKPHGNKRLRSRSGGGGASDCSYASSSSSKRARLDRNPIQQKLSRRPSASDENDEAVAAAKQPQQPPQPQQEQQKLMPPPTKMFYSYLERRRQDAEDEDEILSQEGGEAALLVYMTEAKRLKHEADREADREQQAMKYLQAVLFFSLCGNVNETRGEKQPAFTMYKETLNLIKHVCRPFRNSDFGHLDDKLAVLSLRCQSLLYLKLYKMRRHELKECQKIIGDHIQKAASASEQNSPAGNDGVGGGNTISPTPSPAGSEGSVCSKSSGYTSAGELNGGGNGSGNGGGSGGSASSRPGGVLTPPTNPPNPSAGGLLSVPQSVMQRQHQYCNYLSQCHEMWEMADLYTQRGHCEDFVISLDQRCGPLTLHSSLKELVHYTQEGINMLSREKDLNVGPGTGNI